MSMVNADSVQLFAMLKKMQDSISSIETTKKSVKMKYEQLGAGWQDKKYNELGVVVRDCNKALNDILVIMLQAEKYVALLAKSLSEYESVQLGSTNGISASTPQTSSFAVTPSTPEPKIDNEYYEIEEQYFRQFGHGVPREMLPDSISTEQIKQAMKKCILSKKDNLFELLGIIINDNYLY